MTIEEVDGFFKSQNKRLVIGGGIALLCMVGGIFHAMIMIAGFVIFGITIVICDYKEIKFKRKFNSENEKGCEQND